MTQNNGSVTAWACMAANGCSTLAFINDFTADGRNQMNAEIYRNYVYVSLDSVKCIQSQHFGQSNPRAFQSDKM